MIEKKKDFKELETFTWNDIKDHIDTYISTMTDDQWHQFQLQERKAFKKRAKAWRKSLNIDWSNKPKL